MRTARYGAVSPEHGRGGQRESEAGAQECVLEFSRARRADEAHGFQFGSQDYQVRVGEGGVKVARFPWEEGVAEDLAALAGEVPDREAARRLGERMRRFLDALDWGGHEAALQEGRGGAPKLVVRSAAAELYTLPWELVTLGDSGRHLVDVPGSTLRYEWPREWMAPPEAAREGRVLFAWSEAGGGVPEDKHLLALMKASLESGFDFDARRDVLPRVSLEGLEQALEEAREAGTPVSVLHVLCHGAPLEEAGPGQYGLAWNAPGFRGGGKELVDGGALGAVLAPYADTLRMVVLCACHGGDGGKLASHLGSVAQELHRSGIDMVVASRLPLTVEGSVLLTETLYEKLLVESSSLEEALSAARRRLRVSARGFDWASLQLYARREGEADLRPVVLRPYRGLLAFEAKHRRFFFGRERLSASLLERVLEAVEGRKPRFQVVAGASGAGKSSVVMAGLVPLLPREEWDVVVVRPGELAAQGAASEARFPSLRGLSLRLRAVEASEPLVAEQGASGAEVLEEMRRLRQARPGRRLLLVVDQLEEVFSQLASSEERSELMRVLWTLAMSLEWECVVVSTLRVDHFERCAEVVLDERTRLDKVLYSDAYRVFVAHMEAEEVAAAIERPARVVGLELEAGLVQQLCEDVGQEPGALPLLEYALDLLWEKREGRRLTNRVYEELGGVTGALTRTADRLYGELSEPQRRQARRLLVSLVDFRDAASPQTRRRVRGEEVRPAEEAEAGKAFEEVLEKLVRSRLLVKGEEKAEGAGGEWVQFAHEALIRRWKAVRDWVQEDWEREQQLRELDGWAKAWEAQQGAGDGGASYLLTGDRLGYARRVRDSHRGDLSARSLRFIAESDAAEERRKKLLQTVMHSLAAQREEAERQRNLAIEQRREAERQRASALDAVRVVHARRLYERDPTLAALVLGEVMNPEETPEWLQVAVDTVRRPVSVAVLRGHQAMGRTVAFSPDGGWVVTSGGDGSAHVWRADGTGEPVVLRGHEGEVMSARFSPDGQWVVTASLDRTARVWRADGTGEPVVLHGHEGEVMSARFSPDGWWVVTASSDRTARVWSADGKGKPWVLRGHAHAVWSARFSPDGKRVLTASLDATARVWNADGTGEPVVLRGHGYGVWSAQFSPDGKRVVMVGGDCTARVWSADGQGEPVVLSGHARELMSAEFSWDGKRVVTASSDKTARVWSADGQGEPVVLCGHESEVSSARFSPDGRWVVTAGEDGTARLWSADGKGEPVVLLGHEAGVWSAKFSADGKRVVTASSDKTARVWRVGGRSEPVVLHGHGGEVPSARFSADGTRVVTASRDGAARVWSSDGRWGPLVLRGHEGAVWSARFSADGQSVVTAGGDGAARVWSVDGQGERVVLRGHEGEVRSAELSPDGQRVVTAGGDGAARVWSVDGQGEPVVLRGHGYGGVWTAQFSPDGKQVVTASSDRTARVWRADGQGEPVVLRGHEREVRSARFSPDGQWVVTASLDKTARVWRADGKGEPWVLRGHEKEVLSARFSPDGQWVVTASLDKTARVWSADGQGEPWVLRGHEKEVLSARFSPDGQSVVTASEDGTARVWRADGEGEPVVLRGHRSRVISAEFSPDGKRVMTSSSDGTVRLWTIDAASLQALLRTATTACLSREQRQRFLLETPAQARAGHETCEHARGRNPDTGPSPRCSSPRG